jgi:HlyD family secretion protein
MKRAKAAKQTAIAQVDQAKASLEQNLTDIAKAKIVSPINGIVLIRSIEVGQTVAASMTAPVLFTLAEDLTKMELQVDVDEADVGQVEAGQKATFTVDAYPNQKFPAKIKQVRYGAETTDGVVTYTTLLEVANPNLKLRPGMTATADILVKEKNGIMMVPVAALRFTPELLGNESDKAEKSVMESLMPRPRRRSGMNIKKETVEAGYHRIWRLVNGQPEPLLIKTGESSGRMIEVTEGDVKVGDEVIVGVEVPLQ